MKMYFRILFFFLMVTRICLGQSEYFYTEQNQRSPKVQYTDAFSVNIDSLMLDSIIFDYQNKELIPGIASLIVKNDNVIWDKNYGHRNLQLQLPVEDSTLFLMASISKTFMATAIMQLWENGLIELDNNINDYLPPGFNVVNPYYPNDTITVKMLMTHTSSLKDNWTILWQLYDCGDYPVPYDSFLVNYFTPNRPYYSQLNFHNSRPGQVSDYTNAGSCLLALIVETIAGKPYAEYVRDSIFIPLSMNNSAFFLSELDTNNIATPYLIPQIPSCHTGMAYWPIGQLRTNKFDLSNFAEAYLDGGIFNGNRILDSSTVSMILSDQLGYLNFIGEVQGLIWITYNTSFDIKNLWGHSGGWWGCMTDMVISTAEKWQFLFFLNVASPPNYSPGIWDVENQIAKYAHLYGNIYSLKPSIDKYFAEKNIDTVLFRTHFSNIYNKPFASHLIYSNTDSTIIDSLMLFDDGMHGDSLNNDGIYGLVIPPMAIEDFFSISVSTVNQEDNKYFLTQNNLGFTTAGPVIVDSIMYVHLPAQKRYSIKPLLLNQGNSLSINGVTARIICEDPWIRNFTPITFYFPTLQPGTSTISNQPCALYYDSTYPGYFNLKFEIYKAGFCYWKDSIRFTPSPVGVEDEFNPFPTEFLLSQNYPNPFNPITIIKYAVPKWSRTTLKIFDILGNDIVTLVNEEKPVGTYELNWNADNLPSGVYFYRLQAGDFVQTRKMILLK